MGVYPTLPLRRGWGVTGSTRVLQSETPIRVRDMRCCPQTFWYDDSSPVRPRLSGQVYPNPGSETSFPSSLVSDWYRSRSDLLPTGFPTSMPSGVRFVDDTSHTLRHKRSRTSRNRWFSPKTWWRGEGLCVLSRVVKTFSKVPF